MFEVVIGLEQVAVNFMPSRIEEIIQNVRTILTTPKNSVMLDRDFGVDFELLDNPTELAKHKLMSQVILAIRDYEPRAIFKEIRFNESRDETINGCLRPSVLIEVDENGTS
jgi:phage baseplate assembly protein W